MARPREVTDEEILEAARETFLEHGPGAPTSQIAERLGVSSATLFHRFGSKQELMLAALLPPPTPVERLVFEPGRPFREQLNSIAHLLQSFPNHAHISCLRSAGIRAEVAFARYPVPPPVRVFRALTAFFADARSHGVVSQAAPEHLALTFIGALKITNFFDHYCGTKVIDDQAAYAGAVVDIIAKGVE